MKDKILSNVDLIIQELIESSKKVADFSSEQVPILIKEIINYSIASNSLKGLICLLVIFIIYKKLIPYIQKLYDNDDIGFIDSVGMKFSSIIFSAIPLIVLFSACFNLIKLVLAPRLYLLDYLKDFLK